MNGYRSFMDRQSISETGHRRLLDLEPPKKAQRKGAKIMTFGTLAACAALIIGIGVNTLAPESPDPVAAVNSTQPPSVSIADDHAGFVAVGPDDGAKLMFPMIAGVDYADVTGEPQLCVNRVYLEGSFSVPLDRADIQKLFWGPAGKPAAENPKTDPGDFPVMLMNWAGYTITGGATYDGSGDLWELYVQGVKGEDSFTLRAAPGRVPPSCVAAKGAVTTDVHGVQVSGWYQSEDRDGDGAVEHVCTSEFLANGVGFHFENVGSGGMKAGGDVADDLGGARVFNARAVTQLCYKDGFYLDQFAHTDNIPSWAEENYDALSQALAGAENFALGHPEADFLAYLPAQGPQGYGEFHGRLSYQEGTRKQLSFRWTRGYDDVSVEVSLPEGDSNDWLLADLVDVAVPESYDWRLYDGPICDAVPEQYQSAFYKPVFRAEDMSLEVVQARMNAHDTGGQICHFYVLFDNGAVVSYDCAGVTAQYVWSLVEATL